MIQLLGVIKPLQFKSLRKDHGCRYYRPSQRPASSFIHSSHGTDTLGMKTLFVEKRRAPRAFALEALLRAWPATLRRHRT
jgi:hypothetical protein